MIRKLLLITAISLGMAFAQNPYESTEASQSTSAPAPVAPADDPAWNISIHPVSLVVLTALGLKTLFVTVERSVTPHTSVIIRPEVMYVSSDYYDIDEDDASFDMLALGIIGGFRYYVNPGHKGLYVEAELQFAHVGLDYDDDDVEASASANAFGPYVLVGWKFRTGRATFTIDLGVGYNIMSASAEGKNKDNAEEDAENLVSNGFGTDINLTFGLAF